MDLVVYHTIGQHTICIIHIQSGKFPMRETKQHDIIVEVSTSFGETQMDARKGYGRSLTRDGIHKSEVLVVDRGTA